MDEPTVEPSKEPSKEPSISPSKDRRSDRRRNLKPGIKEGQKRGADGKLLREGVRGSGAKRLSSETQDILEAMRHVHHCGPESDRTYQQDHLRRWMLSSPAQFHDRLLALEAEAGKEKGAGDGERAAENEEVSTAAIQAMIGRVLSHAGARD